MKATRLHFLALGDSYTIGEGVEPALRWPGILADALRARGLDVAPPAIIAETGWTTDELDAALDRAEPRGPFDLVSLQIGVNDQYRKRSAEEYRPAFRGLLRRAVEFGGGDARRVLVLSIPDWGVTPFAADDDRTPEQIGAEVDAFNAVARDEAEAAGAPFVDVTPLFRAPPLAADLVVGDGLHPSGRVYAAWAKRALPVALDALRGRRTLGTGGSTDRKVTG
jgi:lysophospholipase L1-like esterase